MTLESLANELILDLFEYLNAPHLFHSFYNLNSRFNTLLLKHFRIYHLNFQSISKRNFDSICQQQLPFILNQIISLRLSNDDETPTLPNIFLSLGFTLDQFTRLKSLTLNHIYSFNTVNQIIIQCQSLPYLTHLNILKCYLHTKDRNMTSLFNNIWSLSKLISCNLSNALLGSNFISTIETCSTSMKSLSLVAIPCDLNDLTNIFQYTPNLQRFCTTISPYCQNQELETHIPSLVSLKIFNVYSINSLKILENMSNLRYLTIKTTNICLNGYDWETILIDNLPNIKQFRLKMEFAFPYQNDFRELINQLIETYRTPFWLETHRWFVRCYGTIRNGLKIVVLHTLPYTFEEFHFINEQYSQSTCPNEEDYSSYDYVQDLHIEKYNNENMPQSYVRLPNIRYLSTDLPYNDKSWSYITSLDRLVSLYITLPAEDFRYYQLQLLCERASCLYSLRFRDSPNFNDMFSFLSKTTSIRRLDLLENTNIRSNECYNNEACIILANSSLGCQCEVLLIEVENRTDIIYLINNMPNLRVLIFRCDYIRWNDIDFDTPLKNNELFTWLQKTLPTTCLIMRDSNLASSYMRLWI